MAANSKHMRDLYQRLRERGFDYSFVHDVILPDWWDDSMAEAPANRALAEAAIARQLNYDIATLRNPTAVLPALTANHIRFKKRAKTDSDRLFPAVLIAQRLATVVASSVNDLPRFNRSRRTAASIREEILADHDIVNLKALLDYAWSRGIVVLHLRSLPNGPKFDGLATFIGKTPVVVLASGWQGPAWQAFHLAHELGHIFRGHVKPGDDLLVDSDIASQVEDDEQEAEADAFGLEVLTGNPSVENIPAADVFGENLAVWAKRAAKQCRVDPGTFALIYGRAAGEMAAAQYALKILRLNTGSHRQIAEALLDHLDIDDVPESCQHLVESLALDPELVEELIEG